MAGAGLGLAGRRTRLRFLVDNLIDATASSNNPVLSPEAWKTAVDTGGASLLRGAVSFARDIAAAPASRPWSSRRPSK